MHVPFDLLPSHSRIWIYTASQALSPAQITAIETKLSSFTDTWESHHHPVSSSYSIIANRFVVLAADPLASDISGCGIDKSVHVIQELETSLHLTLTDRSLVVFKQEPQALALPFSKIKEKIDAGIVSEDSVFYNTTVQTKAEFDRQFEQLAQNGWIKRYFATTSLKQ